MTFHIFYKRKYAWLLKFQSINSIINSIIRCFLKLNNTKQLTNKKRKFVGECCLLINTHIYRIMYLYCYFHNKFCFIHIKFLIIHCCCRFRTAQGFTFITHTLVHFFKILLSVFKIFSLQFKFFGLLRLLELLSRYAMNYIFYFSLHITHILKY